ncbi:MAG: hypothetical protein K2N32_03545, partial [Clostridia bacterium]|nr:hypothetical protein [Clostridia bacterium]
DTTGRGNVFYGEIFWQLISQISGVDDPNKNTLNALPATKTSAEFRELNDGKDVVVTIGGKKWIATYLSKNDSGEPILTLWLANSSTSVIFHEQAENVKGNYPNNLYGTSSMRAKTLNNGGSYAKTYNATSLTPVEQDPTSEWAIYTMSSVKGSLTSFIEVPDNMSWQHNQSAKTSASQSYNYNNDALDIGGDGDTGSYLNNTGYANWANDTLWLPSVAETGAIGESGIWKSTDLMREDTYFTWVRSANFNYYNFPYVFNSNGSGLVGYATLPTGKNLVRPAFHLNLKFAAEKAGLLGLTEPTDVTAEYTGETLTLADVSAEQKGWYNADKIDLEYPSGGMVDAKTYTVTAKIKDTLAADGLTFVGDPGDGETATTRKFNFTITKKKIGIEEIKETDSGLSATVKAGAIYSGDTGDRAPTFGFTYTSTDGKGYNSDVYPTAIGAYKATVKITNECNYQLDKEYTHTFT